jgi:hypothetical protein
LLGFQGIPTSDADTVVVPPGYTAEVLIAWGDPVANGPEFAPDASNSAADQARQWGMHNDGVVYFPIDGSWRGLLVQNNEYADEGLLFPDGIANWNAEKLTNQSMLTACRSSRSVRDVIAIIAAGVAGAAPGTQKRVIGTSSGGPSMRDALPDRRRSKLAAPPPVTPGCRPAPIPRERSCSAP